jgi:hypothetical protein
MTLPLTPELEEGMNLEQMMVDLLSAETPRDPNAEVAPNAPEDTGATPDEDLSALQKAMYGADFPLATPDMAESMGVLVPRPVGEPPRVRADALAPRRAQPSVPRWTAVDLSLGPWAVA